MDFFSTRGLPSARKVSFWNTISSEVFAAMDIAPRNPGRFDGQIRRESLGALTLMDVRSAAVCIRHTATHLARRAHDSFLLLAPLNGSLQLEIKGADTSTLQPNELTLIDNSRPYTIRHGDDLQTLCLDIPHVVMDRIIAQPERLVGVQPTGSPRIKHSLVALLRSLSDHNDDPTQYGHSSPLLTDALVSLVGAAFADSGQRPRPGPDRLARIRAAIDAHAHDASLRQQDIATLVGLSPRTLRLLLGRAGCSFAKCVLQRRLELAAQRLRNESLQHLGIMQVALECGFNNATHFGFVFKQRYGVTPSRYRAGATP